MRHAYTAHVDELHLLHVVSGVGVGVGVGVEAFLEHASGVAK